MIARRAMRSAGLAPWNAGSASFMAEEMSSRRQRRGPGGRRRRQAGSHRLQLRGTSCGGGPGHLPMCSPTPSIAPPRCATPRPWTRPRPGRSNPRSSAAISLRSDSARSGAQCGAAFALQAPQRSDHAQRRDPRGSPRRTRLHRHARCQATRDQQHAHKHRGDRHRPCDSPRRPPARHHRDRRAFDSERCPGWNTHATPASHPRRASASAALNALPSASALRV